MMKTISNQHRRNKKDANPLINEIPQATKDVTSEKKSDMLTPDSRTHQHKRCHLDEERFFKSNCLLMAICCEEVATQKPRPSTGLASAKSYKKDPAPHVDQMM